MLSRVEYEKSFMTSGSGSNYTAKMSKLRISCIKIRIPTKIIDGAILVQYCVLRINKLNTVA